MNRVWLFTLVVTMGCSALARAGVDSVYTDLFDQFCAKIPSSGEPEDEGGGLRCKGPVGYELIVANGDARSSISVVSPDKKQHDLNYWHVITNHFSSLGPRAEWRMKDGRPIALIVRVNAYENPDQPEKVTSYLAVAKVTKEVVCVTDRIKATGTENIAARKAADSSADKTCLERAPQ